MSDQEAFLGVTQSLSGRRWTGPSQTTDRAAKTLAQRSALPPALCQILARQGVAAEDVEAYLTPRIRDLLPDPRHLKDMEAAATRFCTAVAGRQRIAIFADYDVDGGSSAALLIRWLRAVGMTATLYVPDRIDEGYGPNEAAISALARDHDLIVCVDCGTLSHDALAAAGTTDVIVLDHHLGGETLPAVTAVVNPNRQDETGEHGHLCAAAVVFLMLVEVNRQQRAAGTSAPDLMGMLDLVALATVADVAPLHGVNRAFVRQGLRVMAQRQHPGLVALFDGAGVESEPRAQHLGFVLGPRINAGGRVGKADLGARLLATDEPAEATALAARLEELNKERRAIEEQVRAAAMAQIEARPTDGPLVWAAGDGWHAGVVGIVAARLKEATNRPAVVIGFEGDAGKGSGRSISNVDLGAAIQKLALDGFLQKGGGHKMAAGLSLSRAQLPEAMDRLAALLARQDAGKRGAADLPIDGILLASAATPELVDQIDTAGPFGAAAPAPRFAFPNALIHDTRIVGERHLKLSFSDGAGPRIDAICFGALETPLGQTLSGKRGARAHLAGRLEINSWGGRNRVQLRLEDAALA